MGIALSLYNWGINCDFQFLCFVELHAILKDLKKKENVLNTKLTRFKKQRTVLDNFADSASKPREVVNIELSNVYLK